MPYPRIEIHYCTQCRWLLRASWMGQELLTTFGDDLGEVALMPDSGGVFSIHLDDHTIFSRKQEGRFPETKEIKQAIRDHLAPHHDLGASEARAEG